MSDPVAFYVNVSYGIEQLLDIFSRNYTNFIYQNHSLFYNYPR